MTNQGRFSNRLCEYCNLVDVIVTRAFDNRTKTYEVIARDSRNNRLQTCLGREIDKQYNKKDIPILSCSICSNNDSSYSYAIDNSSSNEREYRNCRKLYETR